MTIRRSIRKWPVEIVYQDSNGLTTRTVVTVYSVRNGKARVLDWRSKSLRTLAVERIVTAVPFIVRAS
ncbi:hypothetical protein COLU111180_05940 [Cohnella lubricantis]|uniref:WYL domain-containing protein n=1 Tax=Cohnella lubricantis TaxID=2163172 RepID=A0A841TEC3_9BACL|nr:hypothetical protein [Cohnella lubricantis]MBB6677580.1 hypothetical protein [Cohnella lubricantis]MBP2116533.1 hypothetical protein [Cohnella lubricantis]